MLITNRDMRTTVHLMKERIGRFSFQLVLEHKTCVPHMSTNIEHSKTCGRQKVKVPSYFVGLLGHARFPSMKSAPRRLIPEASYVEWRLQ